MDDAIKIPIKIIDEATSTLAKIQARVQAFQDNLEGVGKASRHVEKVEKAFDGVDSTMKKATHSNERLLDSVDGMTYVLKLVNSNVNAVAQSQKKSNTLWGKIADSVKNAASKISDFHKKANATIGPFDRLRQTLLHINKTATFKTIRNTLNQVNAALRTETSLFGKTYKIITTVKNAILQKRSAIEQAKAAQIRFNETVVNTKTQVNGLVSRLKGLVATYVGFESAKGLVNMSDEASQIGARLDMINDGSQTTAELQNKIFKAAEQSRGSYTDMASSVAKLQLLTGDTFKSNDEAIQFTGNLQKMFAVCGTGAQESSAAMLQLTQALGSGKLQGDEFRSIMEACPMIVQTLAKHMGVSVGEMKALASEGEITSEVMRGALLGATDEINKKFQAMPYTWSQIWTSIKNGFTKIMQPVLEKINKVFNENREKLASFASSMSKYISKVVDELVVFGEALISLLGNQGVQTFLQSIVYVFTGLLRTITKVLTPLAKFLGYLDRIGVLKPILTTLGTLFIIYAVTVNTATIAIKIFAFTMSYLTKILNGIKIALSVTKTLFHLVAVAIKAVGAAIGVSFGWAIVIVLAVIAVVALLIYYWDEVKAAAIWCWNAIKKYAMIAWNWIKQTWGTFTAWISGIWDSAKTTAISFWNSIKQWGINAWNGVKNAAVSVWRSIWGTVGPLITAFWNFVSAIFRGAWAILSAIMRGIWGVICNVWVSIRDFVVGIVTAYCNYINRQFQIVKIIALAVWGAIKNWIIGVWRSIYGFVAPIVSKIHSYISEKFNAVRSFCSTIWNAVKTAVVEKVTEIYEKVKEWIDKVVDYFTDLREKMIQKGKDFISGFIEGVTSMIKEATDTVTEFCESAVDAINNFFDIGSPSRVMRELGGFVGEGFNLGLEDQINGAKTAAKGLSMETLSGTYAGAKSANKGVSGGSPTITINVHNTINSEGDVKKLVDQITVMLRDAMNNSAKGVYNYA